MGINFTKWFRKVIKLSASVGPTATDFDKSGDIHNLVINDLYNSYGKSGLANITNYKLHTAIIQQMMKYGCRLPDTYNSFNFNVTYPIIQDMINTNNYSKSLQTIAAMQPTIRNECNILVSYLNGMSYVTESDCLQYNIDFRNTINNSSISLNSKNNISLSTSIGYASYNLWEIQE